MRSPCTILLAAAACTSTPVPDERPPNIVLILADDMGFGDARCNNPDSRIATPHIDRIAREGARFTDAHAPGSVCVPSRYGLLTGRYPFRAKLDLRRGPAIQAGRPTLGSLLRTRGYATAMVGKWHLGFDGGSKYDWERPLTGGPCDRGFDSFFGIPASLDIPPYFYIRDRAPVAPPTLRVAKKNTPGWSPIQGEFWRAGGIAPGFRHEDVLPRFGAEAARFVASRRGNARPFFLYLALPAPHTPWLPLAEYRGKSGAGMYGDFVMQVDALVGEVLAAIDAIDATRDTLVIFTSDNGPVWYPTDVTRFGHASVGPLRGMKGDAWEGGHRMPFFVRWPGHVRPGSTCGQTVCFTDLVATCAAITGAKAPPTDGRSMLGLLRGGDEPIHETLLLKRNGRVVRHGRWKLIPHLGSGGFSRPRRGKLQPGGPEGQLYDLEADVGETTNLWTKHPEVVERLLSAGRSMRAPPSPAAARPRAASRR